MNNSQTLLSNFILYISSIFIFLAVISATNAETLTLPSDQEVVIEEYGQSTSKNHILWMHPERGITGELQKMILAVSKEKDIQVLLPDWHDAYFIEPSRSSLEKIPQQDYEDLIEHYAKLYSEKGDKLYIVASSRSSGMVLNGVHHL